MTETQQLILSFISAFIERHGYSPTVREIGAAVGLRSTCTVHHHLQKLMARGMLTYERGKPRTVRVLTSS